MGVQFSVEAKADDRSFSRAADRAERVFAQAGKDASRVFSEGFTNGAKDAEDSIKRFGTKASDAYDKAADAAGKLRAEEAQLQKLRDRGDDTQIIRQAEKVAAARRADARATRDATSAYREYVDATEKASRSANTSLLGGLKSQAGNAASLGRDMADGFSGGFSGGVANAASIARLGAAGGPIGAALMGLTAVGVLVGSRLGSAIADGMATTATTDLFQSRMGLDEKSMAQYAKAAGGAYANNFGASFQDNLATAQAALQAGLIKPGSTDTEVQDAVQQIQAVSSVTEASAKELSRSATTLIRTGLAQNATEAFDIITAGFQKGLDVSGDWLDTINEYSTQFRKLGLDGSEVLTLLKQGFEGGARDTDKVADSLKEFSIRAVDGSKSTKEGFEALGLSAEEMGRRFAAGGETSRQSFGVVLDALRNLDDPMQQALVWQRLFGTQWEDMGDAINKLDLTPAKNQFTDLAGTSDRTTKTATDNFKSEWAESTKTVEQWFNNLKTSLSNWFVDLPGIRAIPGLVKDIFSDPVTSYGPPSQNARPLPAQMDPTGALVPPGAGANVPSGYGTGLLTNLLAPGAGAPIPPNSPLAPKPGAALPPPVPGDRKPIAPTPPDAADKTKPSIDPKLWSLDSHPIAAPTMAPPLPTGSSGGPGGWQVDPMRVFDAETSLQRARNGLEQDRIALIRLEQEGNADQLALLRAKNQVAEGERAYISAQMKLQEAQQGTWKKMETAANGMSTGMDQIGAALEKDFGISKGLPGIAENLTKFLANLAAAPLLGQLSAITQANPSKGGYGIMGMLGAQGAFGDQFTGMAPTAYPGYPNPTASAMAGLPMGTPTMAGRQPYGMPLGSNSGGYGGGGARFPDWVYQLGNAFGVKPSTYPGHQEKDGQNKGIDWSGPVANMQRFAEYLSTIPGAMEQVIWDNPNTGQKIGIANGQFVGPGTSQPGYYGSDWADHQNHVHTRQSYSIPTPAMAATAPPLTTPGTDPTNSALLGGGGTGGMTGPSQGWSPSQTASRIGGVEPAAGTGKGGFGITQGGTIDTAMGLAASGLDLLAPGAGQAAQTGMKLANRAIEYAGQAAGIGVEGLMQTFLPTGGSELANKSWLTKLVGGVAGAAPALPNMAGKATAPPNPQGQKGQGGGDSMSNSNNTTNITVNNSRDSGDGVARDIEWAQMQQHRGPGM